MWVIVYLLSLNALMLESNYLVRSMWTTYLSVVALVTVALSAFMLPGRWSRWSALLAATAFHALSAFAIWLPDPNAIFWLLLFLPFLLGFGLEMAAVRATRLRLALG